MIYSQISEKCHTGKQVAILIDPDKFDPGQSGILSLLEKNGLIDFILVGGSLISRPVEPVLKFLRSVSALPLILFPGSILQVSSEADAIFFLSLISGRNPEYLIGQHVTVAPFLKQSGIEVIPAGYILIENSITSSVEYISNSRPIPADKQDIIAATAMAGEMLGQKLIYLESGSGASHAVSTSAIREVRESISIPLIVGGGIRESSAATEICRAGADIIVLGSLMEQNPKKLPGICEAVKRI